MDILQAASQLRPGTAWNFRGAVLEQSVDSAPRVAPPSMAEIQPILDASAALVKPPIDPIKEKTDWQAAKAKGTTDAVTFLAAKLGLE